MTHLLEVRNLVTRFYSDGHTIHAVNGISYTVDEGEAMAIVGESGSGKSVGVMSIMGLIRYPPGRVEAGEVLFRERDLRKLSDEELRKIRGKEIAMVFQDPMTSLNPVLPVGFQLAEALKSHEKISDQAARSRAIEMLALVGLPKPAERLNNFPFQFSGGQRQRIMIAMALMGKPSLLIADEPTTALDVTIQAQIVELVRSLQQQLGMAIIWISHNLALVAGMVEKVAVMYSGYIVEMAPVDQLYEHPLHPYTLGLLTAIPKIDMRDNERLASIEGMPPDLRRPHTGCPFAPRCPYAAEICGQSVPELVEPESGHSTACFRWESIRHLTTFGEPL